MLSLAPAASTFGLCASTASAGSFCLFCENGDGGLPTLTRVSPPPVASAPGTPNRVAPTASAQSATSDLRRAERLLIALPFAALRPLLEQVISTLRRWFSTRTRRLGGRSDRSVVEPRHNVACAPRNAGHGWSDCYQGVRSEE